MICVCDDICMILYSCYSKVGKIATVVDDLLLKYKQDVAWKSAIFQKISRGLTVQTSS